MPPHAPAAADQPVSDQPSGSADAARSGGASAAPIFQKLDEVNPFPYSLKEYAIRAAWVYLGSPLFRLSFRKANRFRRVLLGMFGAKLAPTAVTKPTTIIRHPWLLSMGEHSCLAEGVEVYNLGPISIGDHSVVSQHTYLCAGTHDYTVRSLPLQRPPIRIGSGVWICARSFIGPNVTIGDNAIVGAGAVVTKDVPAGMIAAGNPAKVLRARPMPGINEPPSTQRGQPGRG